MNEQKKMQQIWAIIASIEKYPANPGDWQALAKVLGKDKRHIPDAGNGFYDWWHGIALQYFDLVLTGGDTEKFWKELLKSKDLGKDAGPNCPCCPTCVNQH